MTSSLRLTLIQVLAALTGLWLGEHAASSLSLVGAALAVFAALAAWPLWRQRRAVALLTAAGTVTIFLVPWLAGARESSLAYNECIQGGERVREDLADYHQKNGRFPERLSALPAHLPGGLLLPPGLLKYERTATGYALAFSDELVEHSATEREAFLAHK